MVRVKRAKIGGIPQIRIYIFVYRNMARAVTALVSVATVTDSFQTFRGPLHACHSCILGNEPIEKTMTLAQNFLDTIVQRVHAKLAEVHASTDALELTIFVGRGAFALGL